MNQDPQSLSPRSKLRSKLKKKEAERAPGAGARPKKEKKNSRSPTTESTADRIRIFPQWIAHQLVRSFPNVAHNPYPFMLLFRFDMSNDPLTTDASALIGSRLDVLLVKINGGIYYESSTHMDGLQSRIAMAGRILKITPAQLLYVCNPANHVANASADITSDVSKLSYVADDIPAAWAREDKLWDVPLDPVKHLPQIKEVDELPEQ
jgi:hypothetical protein